MKITLFENTYDDRGDLGLGRAFEKIGRFIKKAAPANKQNWRKILQENYSKWLVGSAEGSPLLESCQDCSGHCSTCYVKNDKGENNMNLDKLFDEAFNQPYVKPQVEEEPNFDPIYSLDSRTGEFGLTEASKRDQKAYDEEMKQWREKGKGEVIIEADSGDNDKFLAAFN